VGDGGVAAGLHPAIKTAVSTANKTEIFKLFIFFLSFAVLILYVPG
jgi:hypothetical protein